MTLMSATGVSVRRGKRPVLAGVDFAVAAGEMVGLIGPNGAGKTTLLRTIAGLLAPDSGEIRLMGQPLSEIDPRARAQCLGYLPQDGESHWAVTAETLVMMGRLAHMGPWRGPGPADRAAVARALKACDAAQFADRPVTHLSGGERARVLLARVLAGAPKLLLADEPVAGLDPAHQLDVMARLRALADGVDDDVDGGVGVVVVMHDLSLAARFCHRLALLHGGRIAAEGRPETVLCAENLARCYGIRAHRGAIDGDAFLVPVARVTSEARDGPA